ncbi:hypothetical protein [Corynebacterium guangdongense]|uniref:Very-short-patch-repair endonuclease n=1 Tax=Corynebacterium guangdongense TaxID=1783348 RepID=A0ABU1ZYX3_9CORY|nr:hypothetical protein [Corynebacterium guangdongense]MDR7330139.1 very-short-patch-repair endonuclease [Corynebacterium guangdongense]WJZ18697.1 hypothetical protein CGUA_10730 [Corynebacterium guangdongense]
MTLPELIELRRAPLGDRRLRDQLASDSLVLLTPEIAVDRDAYRQLPPWDRTLLRARAVGTAASSAVLTGKAAARLSGVAVRGWDEPIALAYPSGSPPPAKDRRAGIAYLNTAIPEHEIRLVAGVRVAVLSRFLRDIARIDGLVDTVVAIDSIRRRYPDTDEAWFYRRCTDNRRFPGVATLREVIRLSSALAESPLESEARVRLLQADLGPVREQVQIGDHRVDFLVGDDVITEVDGEVKYDGVTFNQPVDAVIRAERRREKALQNAGYVVLRVGAEHLREEGAGLIQLLRQARRR